MSKSKSTSYLCHISPFLSSLSLSLSLSLSFLTGSCLTVRATQASLLVYIEIFYINIVVEFYCSHRSIFLHREVLQYMIFGYYLLFSIYTLRFTRETFYIPSKQPFMQYRTGYQFVEDNKSDFRSPVFEQ